MISLFLISAWAVAAPPAAPPLSSPDITNREGAVARAREDLQTARIDIMRRESALQSANLELEAARLDARAAQLRSSGKPKDAARAARMDQAAADLRQLAETDLPAILDLQIQAQSAQQAGRKDEAKRLRQQIGERSRAMNRRRQAAQGNGGGRSRPGGAR